MSTHLLCTSFCERRLVAHSDVSLRKPEMLRWCEASLCARTEHNGDAKPAAGARGGGRLYHRRQATFFTGGIVHVPSRIDGLVSFGQYIRSMRMNLPAGAGSQLLSFSGPGLSFWMYRSIEPSGFAFRFCRGLIE